MIGDIVERGTQRYRIDRIRGAWCKESRSSPVEEWGEPVDATLEEVLTCALQPYDADAVVDATKNLLDELIDRAKYADWYVETAEAMERGARISRELADATGEGGLNDEN